MSTFPPKENALQDIFGIAMPIIGMVHSRPLPGSPRFKNHRLEDVYRFGVEEAMRLKRGGVDGIMLENGWDLPFSKPSDVGFETVAAMSVLGHLIREATELPLGINTLANAAIQSVAIAQASGAQFVRVNQWVNAYVANEGFIEGPAGKVMRYRSWIGADEVRIIADVHVKHGSHAIVADRPIFEQARDAEFFDADVLIATGHRTGDETPVEEIENIRQAVTLPVIIGSGVSVDNCRELLSVADGAIVGSSVKDNGKWWGEVSTSKVRALMSIVEDVRRGVATG